MHKIIIPQLGFTMTSGIIEKWHKKVGDEVKKGEVLFELRSDKVVMEIESFHSGILRKILRYENEEVPVKEIVAYIGDKDEIIPEN
jgi:pyruvate/2-oxoglutarate dehydrogenase complex dihydrolipoamide acyltransferase (E2) component